MLIDSPKTELAKEGQDGLSQSSMFSLAMTLAVVMSSGSLYFSTFLQNLWLFPILIALLFKYFGSTREQRELLPKLQIPFLVAFLLVLSLNPDLNVSSYLGMVLRLGIGLFFVVLIPFRAFAEAFQTITFWLCVLSLPYIGVVLLGIESPLPPLQTLVGLEFQNFIFFAVRSTAIAQEYFRNSGIFWEPGAFQFIINLAILFGVVTNTLRLPALIIFTVTLMTTQSSTGIIVAGIVALLFFFVRSGMSLGGKMLFALTSTTGFLAVIFYLPKLVLDKFSDDNFSHVSFLSRLYDHQLDWMIFQDHPLSGIGYGNLDAREAIGSNWLGPIYYTIAGPTGADSLLLFISQVGFLGIFLLVPLLLPRYLAPLGLAARFFGALIMVILFSTENMMAYSIFGVLSFYGLQKQDRVRNDQGKLFTSIG